MNTAGTPEFRWLRGDPEDPEDVTCRGWYFWWPAEIKHGPFETEAQARAEARAMAELYPRVVTASGRASGRDP